MVVMSVYGFPTLVADKVCTADAPKMFQSHRHLDGPLSTTSSHRSTLRSGPQMLVIFAAVELFVTLQ
jgi:hypothetical protein